MKKNKIFLSFITSLSMIGTVSIPLSSCGKKEEKKDDPTQTKYTVSFSALEGVTLSSTTSCEVKEGTKWKDVKKPEVTVESDYAGYDWYDLNTRKKLCDDTEIHSNISAKFIAYKKSEVKIDVDIVADGKTYDPIPFIQGYTFSEFKKYYELENPTLKHHTFNGWFIDNIKIPDDFEFPVRDKITINAGFSINKHKIIFEETEGVIFDESVKKGIEVEGGTFWREIEPKVTVKDGFVKYGWINSTTLKELNLDDEISSDITAKCIVHKKSEVVIQVTINVDAGRIYQVKFAKGKTFEEFKNTYTKMKEEPKKKYHAFDGWYVGDSKEKITDAYVFTDKVEIKARFTQLKHQITFSVSNGAKFNGLHPSEIHFEDGKTWGEINVPAVDVEDGFTGFGWYNKNTYSILEKDTILADNNIEAMYVALPSAACFNVKIKIGKTTYGPVPITKGASFADFKNVYTKMKQTPEKTGHDFIGWYLNNTKLDDKTILPDGEKEIIIEALFDKEDFSTCSWNDIVVHCAELENEKITEDQFCSYFANNGNQIKNIEEFVGLERAILINAQIHIIRVIGVKHDTMTTKRDVGGKATLTFELVTLLSNSNKRYIGCVWDKDGNYNYTDSTLRANLNAIEGHRKKTWDICAYKMLPIEVRKGIKEVDKEVSTGTDYHKTFYSNYLFPLTYTEMAQPKHKLANEEGEPYKYWQQHNSDKERIKLSCENFPHDYFLASPCTYWKKHDNIWLVGSAGSIFEFGAKYWEAVTFAFCI